MNNTGVRGTDHLQQWKIHVKLQLALCNMGCQPQIEKTVTLEQDWNCAGPLLLGKFIVHGSSVVVHTLFVWVGYCYVTKHPTS